MRSENLVLLALLGLVSAGCGGRHAATPSGPADPKTASEKIVNLYIWSDYISPDTVAGFEKQTGIKLRVANFDTNETLEGRMLTGSSGFDVVVPTGPFLQRQLPSGAYLPLDKSKLPNWKYLDPAIMARVAANDPGNAHAIVYMWGTYGIGYNEKMVSEALPGIAVNSFRLIFNPTFAAKLAKCGINLLDSPAGIERLALKYLGRDPNAPSAQDFVDVQNLLTKIRPYIRNIDSSIDTEALANGDLCIAITYNGSLAQGRDRARAAKNGIDLRFVIPDEGSILWFDLLAIPRDAPHPDYAHALIDYLMDPQVIAKDSEFIRNANANRGASSFLDPALLADPVIYTPQDVQKRLFVQTEDSPEQTRVMTRIWQKFKTGQ
jgi:putrescine transport system substrate-binding protein